MPEGGSLLQPLVGEAHNRQMALSFAIVRSSIAALTGGLELTGLTETECYSLGNPTLDRLAGGVPHHRHHELRLNFWARSGTPNMAH